VIFLSRIDYKNVRGVEKSGRFHEARYSKNPTFDERFKTSGRRAFLISKLYTSQPEVNSAIDNKAVTVFPGCIQGYQGRYDVLS